MNRSTNRPTDTVSQAAVAAYRAWHAGAAQAEQERYLAVAVAAWPRHFGRQAAHPQSRTDWLAGYVAYIAGDGYSPAGGGSLWARGWIAAQDDAHPGTNEYPLYHPAP